MDVFHLIGYQEMRLSVWTLSNDAILTQPLVVPGGIGCAWCLAGVFLIYDNPSVHPRISANERQYIETALGGVQKVGVVQVSMMNHYDKVQMNIIV